MDLGRKERFLGNNGPPPTPSTNSVSASLLLGSEVLRTIKLHLKKHLLVQKRY